MRSSAAAATGSREIGVFDAWELNLGAQRRTWPSPFVSVEPRPYWELSPSQGRPITHALGAQQRNFSYEVPTRLRSGGRLSARFGLKAFSSGGR